MSAEASPLRWSGEAGYDPNAPTYPIGNIREAWFDGLELDEHDDRL